MHEKKTVHILGLKKCRIMVIFASKKETAAGHLLSRILIYAVSPEGSKVDKENRPLCHLENYGNNHGTMGKMGRVQTRLL
jgi:hypothetical protein